MNYQKVDSDARLANLSGAVDPATGLGAAWTGFSNDFRSEKKSLDVNAGGPFSLFGRRHQLLVGADWTKVRDDQDTFYSEMDTPAWLTNVYDFDPGRIPPAVSERKTRSYPGYGATQKGLYGRVNLSLTDQLTAIVGALRKLLLRYAVHQLRRDRRHPLERSRVLQRKRYFHALCRTGV